MVEKYADKIELAAINTSGSMETEGWSHLLKYNTAYGRFDRNVKFTKRRALPWSFVLRSGINKLHQALFQMADPCFGSNSSRLRPACQS